MKGLLYVRHIDKYLSLSDGSLYSDEELDNLDRLEKQWKESQPRYTFQQLIEIFPEAKKAALRSERETIKRCKEKLREIREREETYYNNRIMKAPFQDQEWLQEDSDIFFNKERRTVESRMKTATFRIASLTHSSSVNVSNSGVTDEEIARAKQVPIETLYSGKLLKRGKRAIGKCPFHNEFTPSFTVYLDQNSFYCYGQCGSGGSVIDFTKKLHGMDFLSAVKFLLKG
jgi:hypothetical protein